MKLFSIIAKIFTALAFTAGIVYLIATYGDKIVAWAKSVIPCKFFPGEIVEQAEEATEEEVEEAAVEETPAEEAPVAEEKDFEG